MNLHMNTLQLQDRSTKINELREVEMLKTQTHMALNFEVAHLADRIYLPESKNPYRFIISFILYTTS